MYTPGNLAKHFDSVRRDEAQDSGFPVSSQVMEMLLDQGLYSRFQGARFFFGVGIGKALNLGRDLGVT